MEDWPANRLYDEAGNGSEEIRNWLLASGTVGDVPAKTLAYEPIPEWHTGIGIVRIPGLIDGRDRRGTHRLSRSDDAVSTTSGTTRCRRP